MHQLFFEGVRIACFYNWGDLLEYVERSVLGGCSGYGWVAVTAHGKRLVLETKAKCVVKKEVR